MVCHGFQSGFINIIRQLYVLLESYEQRVVDTQILSNQVYQELNQYEYYQNGRLTN